MRHDERIRLEPTRREMLRETLLGTAALSVVGVAGLAPPEALAGTEESPETENNWEGPFYTPGAPVRSVFLEAGMPGTPLTVSGRVLDTSGRPLKSALLDIWR